MKTAIDELIEELDKNGVNLFSRFFYDKFKEKEKQQIIDAYDLGMGHYGGANCRKDAEQYYNETYDNNDHKESN